MWSTENLQKRDKFDPPLRGAWTMNGTDSGQIQVKQSSFQKLKVLQLDQEEVLFDKTDWKLKPLTLFHFYLSNRKLSKKSKLKRFLT